MQLKLSFVHGKPPTLVQWEHMDRARIQQAHADIIQYQLYIQLKFQALILTIIWCAQSMKVLIRLKLSSCRFYKRLFQLR